MTKQKKFKARVRARMERNEESYLTSRRNEDSFGTSPQSAFERNRSLFREECLPPWKRLTESVARDQLAKSVPADMVVLSWTTIPEMTSILARIGEEAPLNHVFHPDGGGLDLSGVGPSREEGCIELDFDGSASVVRPLSMRLVLFQQDPLREWAYFVLEAGTLAPSGVYAPPRPSGLEAESVVELEPGRYVSSDVWDEGVYGVDADGDPLPLPPRARRVMRHFGGPFLIMAKASTYNALDSYTGEHARMSASDFDQFMQGTVRELHARGLYGKPHWTWKE